MKRILLAAAVAAATLAAPVYAADIGLSLTVGQPGYYGRLDIGDYPPPQVIYRQPRIIERVSFDRPPIYLRVPPGHARNWRKHCRKYDACGEQVYFVQDNWYAREYVPRYQEQHHERRNDDRDERRNDTHEDKRHGDDHDRGRGR